MNKSIYQWAKEYCGDPGSHYTRGQLILEFLKEEGLQTDNRVLDVGCGALSQGKALIEWLDSGKYVGVDPNGWLIETALQEYPALLEKEPRFSYAEDFNVEGYGGFNYVVSHSILSHVAHWQMNSYFHEQRKSVSEGAIMLASLRLDQYDSFDSEWQYPGNSYFRFHTVQAIAHENGWLVERAKGLRERMMAVAGNDLHDWIKAVAIPTPEQFNDQRLDTEDREKKAKEIRRLAKLEYERQETINLQELEIKMARALRNV